MKRAVLAPARPPGRPAASLPLRRRRAAVSLRPGFRAAGKDKK